MFQSAFMTAVKSVVIYLRRFYIKNNEHFPRTSLQPWKIIEVEWRGLWEWTTQNYQTDLCETNLTSPVGWPSYVEEKIRATGWVNELLFFYLCCEVSCLVFGCLGLPYALQYFSYTYLNLTSHRHMILVAIIYIRVYIIQLKNFIGAFIPLPVHKFTPTTA